MGYKGGAVIARYAKCGLLQAYHAAMKAAKGTSSGRDSSEAEGGPMARGGGPGEGELPLSSSFPLPGDPHSTPPHPDPDLGRSKDAIGQPLPRDPWDEPAAPPADPDLDLSGEHPPPADPLEVPGPPPSPNPPMRDTPPPGAAWGIGIPPQEGGVEPLDLDDPHHGDPHLGDQQMHVNAPPANIDGGPSVRDGDANKQVEDDLPSPHPPSARREEGEGVEGEAVTTGGDAMTGDGGFVEGVERRGRSGGPSGGPSDGGTAAVTPENVEPRRGLGGGNVPGEDPHLADPDSFLVSEPEAVPPPGRASGGRARVMTSGRGRQPYQAQRGPAGPRGGGVPRPGVPRGGRPGGRSEPDPRSMGTEDPPREGHLHSPAGDGLPPLPQERYLGGGSVDGVVSVPLNDLDDPRRAAVLAGGGAGVAFPGLDPAIDPARMMAAGYDPEYHLPDPYPQQVDVSGAASPALDASIPPVEESSPPHSTEEAPHLDPSPMTGRLDPALPEDPGPDGSMAPIPGAGMTRGPTDVAMAEAEAAIRAQMALREGPREEKVEGLVLEAKSQGRALPGDGPAANALRAAKEAILADLHAREQGLREEGQSMPLGSEDVLGEGQGVEVSEPMGSSLDGSHSSNGGHTSEGGIPGETLGGGSMEAERQPTEEAEHLPSGEAEHPPSGGAEHPPSEEAEHP